MIAGLLIGFLGVMLMFREGRRGRDLAAQHAADVVSLRAAYAELDAARVHAEAQANQLRATLAGMSDGVVMLDAERRLVQWNDRFAALIGVPPGSLVAGLPAADLMRRQALAGEFGPFDSAALDAEVRRRLDRFVRGFSGEHTRPDGRVIDIRSAALPDGGAVVLYGDITARRQSEAAERAAAVAAAEALRQRQQFVALVSHEIRVPLDAVIGSLRLLDEGAPAATAADLIATARRTAAGLGELVSDILDLSRLDAGRLVLRPADFDLAPLLAETGEMFRAAAVARGIALLTVVDGALPPRLHGDAGRIRQVLINLVSNAIKYAAPGVVTLRAAPAGRMLKLTVADPGPPIPPMQAAVLFEPFTRLDAAERGGEKGTGLGLAICARLAGLMDGEITHAREAGGNAFTLTVPLEPARGEDASGRATALRRHGRRAHVLLVEDVASNRELTAALLRRRGHRVDLAANGRIAVERAAAALHDVVLMDIHMPELGGVEAARRIRALPGPQGRVPIVALTGTAAGEESLARLEGAMDAVLLKPVRADDLLATLQHFTDPWLAAPTLRGRRPPLAGGLLDLPRIDALRAGLAPDQFARLVEQCLADMHERLRTLTPGDGLRPAAHALAGMAASYGLVGFEGVMRRLMATAADDAAAVAALIAEARAALAEGDAALREAVAAVA